MPNGKPNILIMWGDDIGQSNLSIFTKGMMGYRTPNINSIGEQGMLFTDYYAEQSCTAGRASFITGQNGMRTGLTKVGLPGAAAGHERQGSDDRPRAEGPGLWHRASSARTTLATATNICRRCTASMNSSATFITSTPRKSPSFATIRRPRTSRTSVKKFGPRGVLHCHADGKGGQTIKNTGPLTKKRMETIDEEALALAVDFIKRQNAAGIPFFVWFNTTHMHFRTHAKPESLGQSGRWQSEYHDVMIDHDKTIGVLLDLLEELGIVDDTFVMYSTDNGPHCNSLARCRHDAVPQRKEHQLGRRLSRSLPRPLAGPHQAGFGVQRHRFATSTGCRRFASMAGAPDIKEKLKAGTTIDGKPYKVYIDGICQLDHITGKGKSKREGFLYWTDDGELSGLRVDNWKFVFMEQRMQGTCMIWAEPLTTLRLPKIFNLRTDPYEFADITSNTYWDWMFDHVYLLVPAQILVGQVLETFAEFPPRQKAASFNLSGVLEKMHQGATGGA